MMSREHSDDEDSVVGIGTDRFGDATAETEVELRLPLEHYMEWILKDIPIYPKAVMLRCLRSKPKWAQHGLQLLRTPGPRGQLPGAGAQPVGFGDVRCSFGPTSPIYPGLAQRRPGAGIQPVKPAPDRFAFGIPTPVYAGSDKQLPGADKQLGAQPGFDRFKDSLPDMTG